MQKNHIIYNMYKIKKQDFIEFNKTFSNIPIYKYFLKIPESTLKLRFIELLVVIYKYIVTINNTPTFLNNRTKEERVKIIYSNLKLFLKKYKILKILENYFPYEYIFLYNFTSKRLLRTNLYNDLLSHISYLTKIKKNININYKNNISYKKNLYTRNTLNINFIIRNNLLNKNIPPSFEFEFNTNLKNVFFWTVIIWKNRIIIDHLQYYPIIPKKLNYPSNIFYHIIIHLAIIRGIKLNKQKVAILSNLYHPFYHHNNFKWLYDAYSKKYHLILKNWIRENKIEKIIKTNIYMNKEKQYYYILNSINTFLTSLNSYLTQ